MRLSESDLVKMSSTLPSAHQLLSPDLLVLGPQSPKPGLFSVSAISPNFESSINISTGIQPDESPLPDNLLVFYY
jgi:hypothetical protein